MKTTAKSTKVKASKPKPRKKLSWVYFKSLLVEGVYYRANEKTTQHICVNSSKPQWCKALHCVTLDYLEDRVKNNSARYAEAIETKF